MKSLALAPAMIGLAALAGWLLCRSAGWPVNPRSLIAAAVIVLVASELAILPALRTSQSDIAGATQAGLLGLVGHLLIVLALSGLAMVAKLAGPATSFVYWLAAFYWISLVVVAMTLSKMIRAAGRPSAPQSRGT